MPAKQRHQTAKPQSQSQTPTSPTPKATAKYTNKDGSKFINLPKAYDANAAMLQTPATTNGQTPPEINGEAPAVNRKKQRRREKEAEKRGKKLAAEGAHPNQAQPSRQDDQLDSRMENLVLEDDDIGHFDPSQVEYFDSEDDGGDSGSRGPDSANGYA